MRCVPLLYMAFLAAVALSPAATAGAFDRPALEAALADPARDLTDRVRDAYRKPVDVLEFLGIGTGMSVLELYAGGGYYAVVLSKAVGPDGVVYAQNSPRALMFQEDRTDTTADQALSAKIQRLKLDNVIRIDERFNNIHFVPASLDAVMAAQIFHDYYNRSPAAAQQLLAKLKAALKPGGVLGIIDHYGMSDQDNRRLHRIVKDDVIAAAKQAGFVVEAESDLLRNPRDVYTRPVFDPVLNRNTDRFLLRLRKPAE